MLVDEKGKTRAALAVFKQAPILGLIDEKGKRIWQAP